MDTSTHEDLSPRVRGHFEESSRPQYRGLHKSPFWSHHIEGQKWVAIRYWPTVFRKPQFLRPVMMGRVWQPPTAAHWSNRPDLDEAVHFPGAPIFPAVNNTCVCAYMCICTHECVQTLSQEWRKEAAAGVWLQGLSYVWLAGLRSGLGAHTLCERYMANYVYCKCSF